MGALHAGHLSLVNHAKKNCDIAVASIYVNKRQFNDPNDFDKYPRNVNHDLQLLKEVGCDAVFTPQSEKELYLANKDNNLNYDLNHLDTVLEGKHRPRHFDAVVEVVERLFATIRPTHAFFGLKDYQQFRIIQFFTTQNNLPIQVVGHKTVREQGGLAMSSRNQRLSPTDYEEAHGILKALEALKHNYQTANTELASLIKESKQVLLNIPNVSKVDYLAVADSETLQPKTKLGEANARAFVALHLGDVRLIDNISLNP